METYDASDIDDADIGFGVETGTQGQILYWGISLTDIFITNLYGNYPEQLRTFTESPTDCAPPYNQGCLYALDQTTIRNNVYYAENLDDPGTWSWTANEGSPVPEPSSVGVMSTTLLALAFVARKRSARRLPPGAQTYR